MQKQQEFETRTRAMWSAMARAEGIEPSRYEVSPIVTRIRGQDVSCVLHLMGRGRDDLYLKRIFGPHAPERLRQTVAAHKAALRILATADQHTAPRVLTFTERGGAVLLARAPGRTAQVWLRHYEDDPVARAEIVNRCGAWLRDFHRPRQDAPRPFDPDPVLEDFALRARRIMSGALPVADPAAYLALQAAASDYTRAIAGAPEQVSVIHGDFHAGNLLVSKKWVSGIDLENTALASSGADVAGFLVTYAADFGQQAQFRPGQVVSQMVSEAFFDGYGAGADDPIFLLQAMRAVLQKWSAVRADRALRSAQGQHRYTGLRRIAAHLMASSDVVSARA